MRRQWRRRVRRRGNGSTPVLYGEEQRNKEEKKMEEQRETEEEVEAPHFKLDSYQNVASVLVNFSFDLFIKSQILL